MMVTKWGMSDKVGLFFVDDKDKQSGEFQQLIDDEVSLPDSVLDYFLFLFLVYLVIPLLALFYLV